MHMHACTWMPAEQLVLIRYKNLSHLIDFTRLTMQALLWFMSQTAFVHLSHPPFA